MLSTLPNIGIIDIWNRQNGVHFLIRPPLFGVNAFSDGGQGPEKPPIVEEADSEEEIFTFPYPVERGEISDLVHPPVKGIAGKVYTAQTKLSINFVGARAVPNVLFYLFIDPKEKSRKTAEPEFVSLTRQSEIVSPYTGLLVYTSYAGSNAHFSYASDSHYKSPSFPRKAIYHGIDEPLYESRFPLPIFSERVHHQYQGGDGVDATPLTQPKSQAYQNTIQEPINIEPPKFCIDDPAYQSNVGNVDLGLGLKPDYQSSELELPFLRNESVVLDMDGGSTGNKAVSSSLNQDAYTDRDLTFSHRLDTTGVPKYEGKARVEYKTVKDVVSLPVNLGFDDHLLRDRFIARLNALVTEVEHQSISSGNQARTSDSRLPAETYTAARNKTIAQEAALPKLADFSFFPSKLVLDLDDKTSYVLDRVDLSYRIPEKDNENKPATPQLNYDFAQLGFTLGQPMMRQIAHVGILMAVEYEALVLGFDDPLLIKTVIPSSHDTPQRYSIKSPTAKNGEVQIGPLRNTAANAGYDVRQLDFDLEIPDNHPIEYNRARVALGPYGLFSLGNNAMQGNYRDNATVRSILLPNTEYRANARTDLGNLVRVAYDNGKLGSLPATNTFSTNYVLVPSHLDTQQDSTTTTVSNPDYLGISPGKDLEEVVEEEGELAKKETGKKNEVKGYHQPNVEVKEEVYDGNKSKTGVYDKSKAKEEKESEAEKEDDSSVSALALTAGAVGLGVLAGAAGLVGALFEKDDSEVKDKEEVLKEEPGSKRLYTEKDGSSQRCMPRSAIEKEEKEISDFAERTNRGDYNKGSKKFCFKQITETDRGYVSIDAVDYKAHTTLTVDRDFIQKISKDTKKTIIGIRGKNGGDLTSQYEVSNKSIIALLYARAMDEAENGGKGLTLDVRLDRNLGRYETLREGKLMVKGVFGLDDYDSQYVVQFIERYPCGRVRKRFFGMNEDGTFLSVDQEIPDKYKGYDIELVRLEPEGEKAWKKEADIPKRLAEINQDSERMLIGGGYAPKLFELRDDNGKSIKGAYALLETPLQIMAEDIVQEGIYFVGGDRAVDRDERSTHVALKNDGLLALLDRKIQEEEGLETIYKAMPTQKNRQLLKDNEVFMKAIKGAYEQYQKLHPYVPKERLNLLIVEVDPLTGELSEPGYDPNAGLQFRPEIGKYYQFIVGDGKDISKARISISSPTYGKAEQLEERILEPVLV